MRVVVVVDMASNAIEQCSMLCIGLQGAFVAIQRRSRFAEERRKSILCFGNGDVVRASYRAANVIV